MSGGLQFLAWVRDGIAADLPDRSTIDAPLPARGTVPVTLAVNGSTAARLSTRLHGPGEVTGIDPQQIVRVFPAPGTTNAETTSLAHIELERPDLPWLFTPSGPTPEGRLRPWLTLIVVPAAAAQLTAATEHSLAALTCAAEELPDLSDSWAWAHAQVTLNGPDEAVADVLAGSANRTLSRIICPRRLERHQQYVAALVPAFDAGRKTGLGLDLGDTAITDLTPAWTSTGGGSVTTPIYHHWTFATGDGGDFESLVRRLKPRTMPDTMGLRPMSLVDADPGLPTLLDGAAGSVLGLEGALRAPTSLPTPWPDSVRSSWHAAMRTLLAGSASRLTPPVYGDAHAGVTQLPPPTGDPRWLRELNVDPRSRAAAAVGTQVIQRHQEALAASAWAQAAAVRDANELLHRAQLAREVSTALHRRLLAPQADPGAVLQVTAPAATAVTSGPRTTRTIASDLATQPTVQAATSSAFRRLTRPRGPLARRLTPPDNLTLRASSSRALSSSLLDAAAGAQITPVPTLTAPPGIVGIESVITTKTSTFQVLGNVIITTQVWWRPPRYLPAPDLGGRPATVATTPSDAVAGRQVFVGTADGRLFELRYDQAGWRWRDHGKPPGANGQPQGASVRDTPAVIDGQQRVFVTTTDGRVVQRYWTGDRWLWRDHLKPVGAGGVRTDVSSAPAACGTAIFAVTTERKLAQLTWTDTSSTWTSRGAPDGPELVGDPGAAIGASRLFVRTTSGLAQLSKSGSAWIWTTHPAPTFPREDLPERRLRKDNRPGGDLLPGPTPKPLPPIRFRASIDPGAAVGTTVIAGLKPTITREGGSSVGLLTPSGTSWKWSLAPGPQTIASAAGAAMMNNKCFASSTTGRLTEIYRTAAGDWQLIDHGVPVGRTVIGRPGGALNDKTVHVRDSAGALAALDWTGQAWAWTSRGVPQDQGGDGGWNEAPPFLRDAGGAINSDDSTWAAPIGFMSALVTAHIDTAGKVYHRVGGNLDFAAEARDGWTDPIPGPQPALAGGTASVGIALADLSGNGTLDMLVLTAIPGATSSSASYVVGWDVGADGVPARWSTPIVLPDPLGPNVQAVDITLAPIAGKRSSGGAAVQDLVLAYVTGDGPTGSETRTVFYRIGWTIDASGTCTGGWSDSKSVPGKRTGAVRGIGVAVSDLDDDTLPDIIIMIAEERPSGSGGAVDTLVSYQLGHRINRRGNVIGRPGKTIGTWDPDRPVGGEPIGARLAGLSIAVADISGSRSPDLIVLRTELAAGGVRARYRIGFDLRGDDGVRSWSGDLVVPTGTSPIGQPARGAAIALGDLDPARTETRSKLAANYAKAASKLQKRIDSAEHLARSTPTPTVALTPMIDRLRVALDPERTVTAHVLPRVTVGDVALSSVAPGGTSSPGAGDPLREITAEVSFPIPAYELLREISPDLLLPGVANVPPDTVTLQRANPGFIEAFLVGLNHELSRELLWRDFPGDRRTTYFRNFWDARGGTGSADIPPIVSWRDDVELGGNASGVGAGGEGNLVLLVRGELLRRYPDATITARRAVFAADGVRHDLTAARADGPAEMLPSFTGSLSPDLLFFGFDMTVRQARGSASDPGWFFVLREHVTAPRFGVDEPVGVRNYGSAPAVSWRDLDWSAFATSAAGLDALRFVPVRDAPFAAGAPVTRGGVSWARNGAHTAGALIQLPVQVAIHASDMIPPLLDGWQVTAVSKRVGGDVLHRITELAGMHADGSRWRLGIDEAISAVERGEHFYVQLPGAGQTRIVISYTGAGRRYLRTVSDSALPNNLLALPEPDGSWNES